jgi:preprotein translocase subunit SecD
MTMTDSPSQSRSGRCAAHGLALTLGAAVMAALGGCGPAGPERAVIRELQSLGAALTTGPGGKVTGVDLGHIPVGDTQLASLAALTSLESLTLNVTNVSDEGLQQLAALMKLKSLRLTAPRPESGTRIVLALDVADPAELSPAAWDRLTSGVGARVAKTIVDAPRVVRTEDNQLELIVASDVPGTIDRAVRAARQQGRIEFALLANEFEHADIIAEARTAESEVWRDGKLAAVWRPVGRQANGRPREVGDEYGVATREQAAGEGTQREFLMVYEQGGDRRITSDNFERAYVEVSANGLPCIGFVFDTVGGYQFGNLTGAHVPQEGTGYKSRLAILIDGEILSAPSINDMISDRGIIEGDFSEAEVAEHVERLNSDRKEPGILPARVRVEPYTIDRTTPATEVTVAGVQRLQQRLPGCDISVEF